MRIIHLGVPHLLEKVESFCGRMVSREFVVTFPEKHYLREGERFCKKCLSAWESWTRRGGSDARS